MKLDLSKVADDEKFRQLVRGYLEGLGGVVSEPERRSLGAAGAVMALENAARFLADHLAGDLYFRILREGHNLDRARTQLRLLARMLDGLTEARLAVEAVWSDVGATTRRD